MAPLCLDRLATASATAKYTADSTGPGRSFDTHQSLAFSMLTAVAVAGFARELTFFTRPDAAAAIRALAIRALAVDRITRPERYFLLAATGDEVLDYRAMVAHYRGAKQHVIDGSDHGISEFKAYVDDVLAFCLPPGQAL